MPHLAGRCDCGRKMHFPKNATIGEQWKCYKCGKTWTLSNHGKPLHSQNSKAPPKRKSSSNSPQTRTSGTQNTNIGSLLLFIATIVVLYFFSTLR